MRKLLSAAALLALTVFWACHLSPTDNQDHFDIIGDTTWTQCDTVLVVLLDSKGKEIDTIFNGVLHAISQLKGLSADKYDGTSGSLVITGKKAGGLCFEEKRSFEGDGQSLKVDTVKSLTVKPDAVLLDPESLSVSLDGAAMPVRASIKPSYAEQAVTWTLSPDGIVSLTKLTGGDGTQVKIQAQKIGTTTILVTSVKDPSKTAVLKVKVTPPSGNKVTLDRDSVLLYAGGGGDSLVSKVEPATVDQQVTWRSMNPDVVRVDSAGRIVPIGVGETYVNAKSVATSENASALVIVKRDVPVLTIASKSGAPVNSRITFSPHSRQAYGIIVMYKWDLAGDGVWDDSSSVPGIGKDVDLQPQSTSYTKEGVYNAKFYVRDGEGNEATANVSVDIGNQAPEILAIRADTAISIKDSIAMTVSVRDVDGKVAWCGWDYDGDGVYDDSVMPGTATAEIKLGHRYPDAGPQLAIFKAMDETGKPRLDTVRIKVELDRPVANLGADTTVVVGTAVNIHARATDKYGKIEKWEIRLNGSGTGFHELKNPDTTFAAPAEPGTYLVVLKVTDDDGLIDLDSMNVTVILSANADLANLVFSAGPLDPVFKPSILFFSAHANFADSAVTVTPTVKDASSKISVNAKPVASGSPSDPVKLVVGSNLNVFQIIVTAADGTQRVYSLSVARDPSVDATLAKLDVSGFVLKPVFASNTVAYADTVPSTVASVTLKPTLTVSTASLTVNDSAMASGTATFPMPLSIGENLFKIAVTSQSGTTKTVYQVKVIRRAQLLLLRSLGGKPATQTDSSEVVPGAPQNILSAPFTGYHFVKWTVLEGLAVLADSNANPTALTLKAAKVRAQAEFVINKYTINAGGGVGGGIAPSGAISVDHGSDASFTITINNGFRIKSVTVDGADATAAVSGGVYAFKNVTADHAIAVAFAKVDTLTTKFLAGGKITPPKITVDDGADTAFIVTPDAGYRIKTFTDNNVDKLSAIGAGGRYAIKADGTHVVEATWIKGILLTGSAGDGGGDITPKSITVDEGANQDFAITANPNYRIYKLLDNGADSTVYVSPFPFKYTIAKVDKPHDVGVSFWRLYNISMSFSGPGQVSPAGAVIDSLASRSFDIKPNGGAHFDTMWVDGVPTAGTGTVSFDKVTANHSLVVKFIKSFAVTTTWGITTTTNGLGGSISPANPTVDSLKSQDFLFTANAGYKLQTLSLDGNPLPLAAGYTLPSVTSIHTLNAGFWKTFNMTASVSLGLGSITPASLDVDSLADYAVDIKPAASYRFMMLQDNGKTVTSDSNTTQYGFTKVLIKHDLKAFFWRKHTLTSIPTDSGKITIPNPVIDSMGSESITISPNPGYRVDVVYDYDTPIATSGFTQWSDQFVDLKSITANHQFRATFKRYFTLTSTTNDPNMGSIGPASINVDTLGSVDFTLTPVAGFHLSQLIDNDLTVAPAGNLYSLPVVVEDHKISATFIANPVYKLVVGDSADGLIKGETSTHPKICVTIGESATPVCQVSPLSVDIVGGTGYLLQADLNVHPCNVDGCLKTNLGWFEWVQVNLKGGGVKVLTEPNPMTKPLTINANTTLKAVYK